MYLAVAILGMISAWMTVAGAMLWGLRRVTRSNRLRASTPSLNKHVDRLVQA